MIRMNRNLNRDLLGNPQNIRRVANATMAALHSLQRFTPEEQMLAASVVFAALIKHWDVPASTALNFSNNIVNDQIGKRPEFGTVYHYIQENL
jgi:uncharacterized protein (UPF0147 family)